MTTGARVRVRKGAAARGVVAVLVVLLGAAGLGACRSTPRTVRLFGDSLTAESIWAIREQAAARPALDIDAQGGSALCDWRPAISGALAREELAAVVVQFSGNALTGCMRPGGREPGPAEVLERYRSDTEAVLAETRAAGIPLVLIGSPPRPEPPPGGRSVDDVYRAVAAASGGWAVYVDAGAALAGPGGWTATLPCLPNEAAGEGCVDGQIPVRSPDRAHFCPGTWREGNAGFSGCGQWSSGAWRYGGAIARAIPTALRRGAPFGVLEDATGLRGELRVAGWALDPDAGEAPVDVAVHVDGARHVVRAGGGRPDVAATHGFGASHGFAAVVPAEPGLRRVCVDVVDVGVGDDEPLGCRDVVVTSPQPVGVLDAVVPLPGGLAVAGWAIDPDAGEGAIDVRLSVDGTEVVLPAVHDRVDVGGAFGLGAGHGFLSTVVVAPGPREVCAHAVNVALGSDQLLECRTVEVPRSGGLAMAEMPVPGEVPVPPPTP